MAGWSCSHISRIRPGGIGARNNRARACAFPPPGAGGGAYIRPRPGQTFLYENGALRLPNGVTTESATQRSNEYSAYVEWRLWRIGKKAQKQGRERHFANASISPPANYIALLHQRRMILPIRSKLTRRHRKREEAKTPMSLSLRGFRTSRRVDDGWGNAPPIPPPPFAR